MKKIFFSLILIFFVFALSRFVLEPYDIYEKMSFVDIPMHILGGAAWSILFINIFDYLSKKINLKIILLLVFTIGFIWEIYEINVGISNLSFSFQNGLFDTLKDLFNDIFGGFISYKMFFNIDKNKNNLEI